MRRIQPIKAVMTPFPYSIDREALLAEAETMLAEHQIRHLPVVDGGRLVGVITDREVELARRPGIGGEASRPLRVLDLYTERACVVELDEPIDNVLLRMAGERVDSALVVRRSKLVGIFTVTDACRRFAEMLREDHPIPGDDAA